MKKRDEESVHASPGEGRPLSLQVLAKGLLYLAQQVSQALQGPLDTLDVKDIHHHWGLAHLLHQVQELSTGGERQS